MLEFLVILAAALAGFVHASPAAILIASGGLFAMSYRRYSKIYDRGMQLGLRTLFQAVALRSSLHALAACGLAFGAGFFMRAVAGV